MFQEHLLTKFLLEYQVNIHIIARVRYKYRFNNLFGSIHQCILRIFNYVPFKYLILILLMSILFVICLLKMHNCVSLDVGKWRLLNIYLLHIPYFEIYGIMFVIELGFVGLIRLTLQITLLSLLICQERQQQGAHLCNFCGCCVCECCGLNVIISSLITPKILYISWLKRFKCILIGG